MAQIILDSNNNLIQGDFDNATLNNRTKLQTTTTNATTNVYVVPNGSSTSAGVSVANNSSLTNASKIVMATNGSTDTQIISGVNGSGTYLPLSFYTNNALAMQIDTSGNVNNASGTLTFSAATKGIVGSSAFSVTLGSGVAGNILDLSTAMPAGSSGIVNVSGTSAGKSTILCQRDNGGYYSVTELGTQPRGTYITSITLSGTNLRITNSTGASETFLGHIVIIS